MEKQYEVEVGVDVSKKTIDVCSVEGRTKSYNNTQKGIAMMFKEHVVKKALTRVTCESTGAYSNLLIKECLLKKIAVSMVNPLLVKNYIKSFGCLAKTDPIDANYIRKFAVDRNPKRIEARWLDQDRLKQFQRKKKALIKGRAALKASRDKYDEAFINGADFKLA
jgi:transposase